jgi:hypothetical protein
MLPRIIRGILAIWLVVVFVVGVAVGFVRPPGTPPIPLLIGAVLPLIVFLAAYGGVAAFRAFILAIDPVLATAIQAWRAGGLVFLALYARGIAGRVCVAGRAGRHCHRGHGAVGSSRACPPTRFCEQSNLRGLESAGYPGPRRSGWYWSGEFSACLWQQWGRDHRADGAVTACADPGVPGAVVRHAAPGCALPGTTARVGRATVPGGARLFPITTGQSDLPAGGGGLTHFRRFPNEP